MSHRSTSVQCCWILKSGGNAGKRCPSYTGRRYNGEPYCSRHIKNAEQEYFGQRSPEDESEGETLDTEELVSEEDEILSDDYEFIERPEVDLPNNKLAVSRPSKDRTDISKCFEQEDEEIDESSVVAPSNIKLGKRKRNHTPEQSDEEDIDDEDTSNTEPPQKVQCLSSSITTIVASNTLTNGYLWILRKVLPAFEISTEFAEYVSNDPVLHSIMNKIVESKIDCVPDLDSCPELSLFLYTAYMMFSASNKTTPKVHMTTTQNEVIDNNNNNEDNVV